MKPIEPTVLHEGGKLVVFAKDQEYVDKEGVVRKYIPLPASVDDHGLVMTEWEPTPQELERLLIGGHIRLWLWTKVHEGQALTPLKLEVPDLECGFTDS